LSPAPRKIAVIGAGISGLSAAWLASKAHDVTLYEAEGRLGGHANTVEAAGGPVDTGFIVYNEPNYPNLTALFAHLGVATEASDMSFGVSMDGGAFEYGSTSLRSLLAQRRNLIRPRFWSMMRDLKRFYETGSADPSAADDELISLADYLEKGGFCAAFREDHLLPQAAAIWSASQKDIARYPAAAFLRFFANHGLMNLDITKRPIWRTVTGGSRRYVAALAADFGGRVLSGRPVRTVLRDGEGATVIDATGGAERYDEVVIAAHADQALRMLDEPTAKEARVLGAFGYSRNLAVLHQDASFMPSRKAAWSSWNHLGRRGEDGCVTYWMNRLQNLNDIPPLFLTLNPTHEPEAGAVLRSEVYEHPLFDVRAIRAQRELWSLQGERRTHFCGAYFGSGFHEDGLQAGLAVAEALGGVTRPWDVPNASGRIFIPAAASEGLAA